MSSFYTAIKKDSVFLLRFPFRNHVHDFCAISPVCRILLLLLLLLLLIFLCVVHINHRISSLTKWLRLKAFTAKQLRYLQCICISPRVDCFFSAQSAIHTLIIQFTNIFTSFSLLALNLKRFFLSYDSFTTTHTIVFFFNYSIFLFISLQINTYPKTDAFRANWSLAIGSKWITDCVKCRYIRTLLSFHSCIYP